MEGDDVKITEDEVMEVNLMSDHEGDDELLDDIDKEEVLKMRRNDSGLETSDSMDVQMEVTPLVPASDEIVNLTGVSDSLDIQMEPEEITPMTPSVPPSEDIANITLDEIEIIKEPLPKTPCESPEKSVDSSRRSSTSFIDGLLGKFGFRSRSETIDESASDTSPNKSEVSSKLNEQEEDLLDEMEPPIALSKSKNPNMLQTPIVENPSASSVFCNSDEEFKVTVAKHLKDEKEEKKFDKTRMSSKSLPPKMNPPNYTNIPKPRTLAEKRMLISTNMDFLMIEQENKIFKQIERKRAGEAINLNVIESMANEDIPIKYGPWKALQWLTTEEGNYIQQQIEIDGTNYKLNGSRGNQKTKFLKPQSNKPYPKIKKISLRSVRCCAGGKIKRRDFDHIVSTESIKRFVIEESLEPYKRLESIDVNNQLCSMKPRPLSKKIEFINQSRKLQQSNEDYMFLGDFSKFEMPKMKLEVTVQNKVPLNPVAKQYLNELIPHQSMTKNWLNFALSPIKSEDEIIKEKQTFEFTVPYEGDKRHILVRDILKSKQDTEQLRILDSNDDDIDEMEWTFAKDADKNDPIEMEVVDVIKDLTNSVFINLNDDLFTKDDNEDRSIAVYPITPTKAIEELATHSKNPPKNDKRNSRVLLELKRLNANVVKSDLAQVVDDEDMLRRHATAHLGKEERELRATVIVTENDTVVLENKKKDLRRKKQVPKKYLDYLKPNANTSQTEEEKDELSSLASKKSKSEDVATKTKTPPPERYSSADDQKAIRQEVQKWLHVTVDINRMELPGIVHYCMLHNAYKCACKSTGITHTPEYKAYKKISAPNTANNSLNTSRANSPDVEDDEEMEEEDDVHEDPPRRVLPVDIKDREKKIAERVPYKEMPQIEILNLGELINSGIGPIYINIYDTKENRIKPVFRKILNNKTALIYIEGYAYHLDTTRIDVKKLSFEKMKDVLEHPIFVITPKQSIMPTISLTDDFVQLLFKENSDILMDISDKKELKEISEIIEGILLNAKKKVESQFSEHDKSDVIKYQLNMISRKRLDSESTNSSDSMSSPTHFQGHPLPQAPAPGIDTEMMKEFNKIFSVRMQRLCMMVKTNVLGLKPVESYFNKFYIFRWDLLLHAYENETIFIWQVKMVKEEGTKLMMAITEKNQPPTVENVSKENIVNLRKLSLSKDSMTELARLIIMRAENPKTQNMTVLLFGCRGYFRICGVLNNKENFVEGFVAKPTRVTHPRLTAKIQKIYNIWHEIKLAKEKRAREQPKFESSIIIDDDKEKSPIEMNGVQSSEKAQNMIVTTTARPKTPTMVRNMVSTSANESKQSERKWFLFNVTNDFSDIFVKQWNRYLPYATVMKAIQRAKQMNKTIQLVSMSNNLWPRVYALPSAPLKFKDSHTMTGNFIIFGPYLRSANSNLLLMQTDGVRKYLRDDFEKLHNINRTVRTRCIWIYANTLKCITEENVEKMMFTWDQVQVRPGKSGNHYYRLNQSTGAALTTPPTPATTSNNTNQEKTLKISSIVGGFTDKIANQNGST